MLPILIYIVGYTAIQLHIKSPYCLWQYMVLSVIIWMGYWFKHYVKADTWNTKFHIFGAVTGVALIALATSYGYMARLQPANINKESITALALMPALAGVSIYSLSALLNKTKLRHTLAYIGNHSFSIMALHFLAFKVVNLIQIGFYGYNIKRLAESPVINYGSSWEWGVIYVVTGVGIPLMLTYIYNNLKQ